MSSAMSRRTRSSSFHSMFPHGSSNALTTLLPGLLTFRILPSWVACRVARQGSARYAWDRSLCEDARVCRPYLHCNGVRLLDRELANFAPVRAALVERACNVEVDMTDRLVGPNSI